MTARETTIEVRRLSSDAAGIAIGGDVTSACEARLLDAYDRATADGARVVILEFGGLAYMNSGGIGLLVTLLLRARRDDRRLMAVGLSDHYREIIALTRLDESIGIHATVADALSAAGE
jgi:anti-sigma B factor antagonist